MRQGHHNVFFGPPAGYRAEFEAIAHKVAVAALKFADLSNSRTTSYVFDLDRFMSFEGKTGPYLLYQAVRIKSLLRKAAEQLRQYLRGERQHFDLPLDLGGGTPFQQAVWKALLRIPTGHTTSYGALGRQIGKPAAVRAVGAAVGRNPLSVVVPCHRVLGQDGSLTGYAGGLDRKATLLHLEGALPDSLNPLSTSP